MELGFLHPENISTNKLAAIQEIADQDFSRFKARMQMDHPVSAEEATELEFQVKRGFAIMALEERSIVWCEKVDPLVHYSVLHTREYRDFCRKAFDGRFLHHVPALEEDKAGLAPFYTETRDAYVRHFGEPPARYWDPAKTCCGGCFQMFEEKAA